MSRGARTRPSTLVGAWVGNGLVTNLGDYESIATTTLSSSATTITFASIPSTYKHLQIRAIGRTDRASQTLDSFRIQFNSITTTSQYRSHYLVGTGSSAGSGDEGNTAGAFAYRMTASSSTSGMFGASIVDILDYADTNKHKTLRSLGGTDQNGSGEVYFSSGVWMNTAAISRIDIVPNIGTNFVQYTQFALYGING